jgi:dTDP-4-amino-4,6-dideoxygalactose transaminase
VKVPLLDLTRQHARIRAEVIAAATEVIDRQAFIRGEPVARFERRLAGIAETEHAVGVASGTDAMVLALRALGLRAGEGVITTPLTFVATAEAIVAAGGRPIFADVDPQTLTLDPSSAEEARAAARRAGVDVRAILPVHLFGLCADMQALRALAATHALWIVEDAAQAVGARDADRAAGSLGDAGCFSFFPSKNLGGWGDGGAVATNDARLAERIRSLALHGLAAGERDLFVERGMNSRLDALQAAVLDVKARHLEAWTEARRALAARYRAALGDLPGVEFQEELESARHVYHQFVIRTPQRDALARHLEERGIETRAYYARPLHRQPAYEAHAALSPALPNADIASRAILALPMFPELREDEERAVVDGVRSFFEGPRRERRR